MPQSFYRPCLSLLNCLATCFGLLKVLMWKGSAKSMGKAEWREDKHGCADRRSSPLLSLFLRMCPRTASSRVPSEITSKYAFISKFSFGGTTNGALTNKINIKMKIKYSDNSMRHSYRQGVIWQYLFRVRQQTEVSELIPLLGRNVWERFMRWQKMRKIMYHVVKMVSEKGVLFVSCMNLNLDYYYMNLIMNCHSSRSTEWIISHLPF